jgi:hypothetical protein
MPVISIKKVLIFIGLIILLIHLKKFKNLIVNLWQIIYDNFEPLRRCSLEWRYVVTLMFLALLYITVFKIIKNKSMKGH